MFKGQTIKCSFEWTGMYFKTDKRWLMTLIDSGSTTSSQGALLSPNSGLYPVSNSKEELFFNINYMRKKLIFKIFSSPSGWQKCIFGDIFPFDKIHVDVLKNQIIFSLLVCILDLRSIVWLFFNSIKVFFYNKSPLVTEEISHYIYKLKHPKDEPLRSDIF